jgi:hypothetical protein
MSPVDIEAKYIVASPTVPVGAFRVVAEILATPSKLTDTVGVPKYFIFTDVNNDSAKDADPS